MKTKLFSIFLIFTLASCSDYIVNKLFLKGDDYFNNSDYVNAKNTYTAILEIDSINSIAYYKRAACYSYLNMTDSVLSDYSKIISLDKKFPYVFNSRGFVYLALSETELAISDFKMQLEYYPKNVDSFYGLSKAYFNLDSIKLAEDFINNAIELDSTFSELFVWKGKMLFLQNRIGLALDNYNIALKHDSSMHDALYGKGVCLLYLGDYQRSEYLLKKVIKLNPQVGEYYMSLGFLYLKQERVNEARSCYKLAHKLGIEVSVDTSSID